MHSDFFFFQMKAHLGIGHSKHGTSCMYAKLLVPKCRVFWTLQSLGSCLKKKLQPDASMLHKKIAPNSYWNSSYLRASKSSSGTAWVLRRSDQGLLIFMA
jgi:hypothetical protein